MIYTYCTGHVNSHQFQCWCQWHQTFRPCTQLGNWIKIKKFEGDENICYYGASLISNPLFVLQVVDKAGQTLITPEVGMTFESEKKAFDTYNTYAGRVGFSVRKSNIKRRADKTIRQKYMVYSSQGYRETKSSKDTTRTGCNAWVQFSVSRGGFWTMQKVVLDHNHYLASPNKKQKLRSQRSIQEADKQLIGQIRETRMKLKRPDSKIKAKPCINYRIRSPA